MFFDRWSLRSKIITVSILLPTLLLIALFAAYASNQKELSVAAIVEKARSICLATESTRQGMEDYWATGVFTVEQLRDWADHGKLDQVVAAVPVVTAWKSAMRKAGEAGYEFRVPKNLPRNPQNQPDIVEAEALRILESGSVAEHFVVDEDKNAVRYFRPIKLTSTCMYCHGDPADSKEYWGNSQGLDPTGARMENWKVGEVHGAFEVVQSLDEADAQLASSLRFGGILVIVGLVICALLLWFALQWGVNKPISNIIESLNNGSLQLTQAANEVSGTSQGLAQGASEQASSIEEISASIEQMSAMTRQNADNSHTATSLMEETSKSVRGVESSAGRMSETMNSIQDASAKTSKIVKTIDEIAFQTNLLALNAAVEAARAGEAGKGFAVVAEEVRNLAMRSAEAAKETNRLIEETVSRVNDGGTAVAQVSSSLGAVTQTVTKAQQLIREIAAASSEQAEGITQVTAAISQMDKVTQSNAAAAEEGAAAAEELSGQAESLTGTVNEMAKLVQGDTSQRQERPARRSTLRFNVPKTSHSYKTAATASKTPITPAKLTSHRNDFPLDDDDLNRF